MKTLLTLLIASATVFAQAEFAGEWSPVYHEDGPERAPGPELGDYMGLPLTPAARLRADSYDADRISVVMEFQCRPHSSDYGMRGAGNLRVWQDYDNVTQRLASIRTYMPAWGSERTIWMDGRPHPAEYAEYTFQGFSTGVWEGNTLTITTSHLKANYLRRNGVPRSDKAKVTEHWMRHRDYLTVVTVVDDPVTLTEPLVRSQSWVLDPGQRNNQTFCETAPEVPKPEGTVPHHLPGKNTFLSEVAEWYGLPLEATRGGAETLYPEYRQKMPKPVKAPPAKCDRFCICTTLVDCQLHQPQPRR